MVRIATELGKRQVVTFEGLESKVLEFAGEYVKKALGVVLRHVGDGDDIQIDLVAPGEIGPFARNCREKLQTGVSSCLDDVDIGGRPCQPVAFSDDEPAKTMDPSTGKPKPLGDLWTLEKNGRKAICVLVGHPLGSEVRVSVDGDFKRSAVFKDSKDMIDAMDEWRRLFDANGWRPRTKCVQGTFNLKLEGRRIR